jgi:hypothetical protein
MNLSRFPIYWSRLDWLLLLAIPAVAAVAGVCGWQVNP